MANNFFGLEVVTEGFHDCELQTMGDGIPTAEAIKEKLAQCRASVRTLFRVFEEIACKAVDDAIVSGTLDVPPVAFDLSRELWKRAQSPGAAGLPPGVSVFFLMALAAKEVKRIHRAETFNVIVERNTDREAVIVRFSMSPYMVESIRWGSRPALEYHAGKLAEKHLANPTAMHADTAKLEKVRQSVEVVK